MKEENFFFLDRSQDIDVTFGLIDKIQKNWVTRFDCILEQWLINHPECSDKIAFRTSDQTITWRKILEELRKQSTIGKSFEKMVNQFYIYQFTENSEANE